MKSKIFKFFIIIVLIMLIIAFNSSYKSLSLSNISIVVAMAIDTSDSNNMRVTFQFTKPTSTSDTGSNEESPSIINSVDASSISSAINLMNAYIGKKLTLSHCKLIVFSEEFAQKGISDEVFTLMNDNQVRPSTNIVISKCTAKYYIENSKPIFDSLISKYYETYANSSQYTGYTTEATIGDFFNSLNCKSCEPYAILGGINSGTSTSNSSSITNSNSNTISEANTSSVPSEQDSNIKSNESAITGHIKSENIGLAVFKGDKIVGELTAIENLAFLCTKNEIDGFLVSVPDPQDENKSIDVYLTPQKKSKMSTKIVNGSPYVTIEYSFTGRIYSMSSNSDYLDDNMLTEISNTCDAYLESVFSSFFYKTAKIFNSDIVGVGKSALSSFRTSSDFENYNWEENYKNSFFDITVNSIVKSGFLLM